MKKEKIKLSRPNKILLVMYELSNKRKKSLRFEDIVVALFKQYKEDFHMRGYPQYPDSEGVGKELYRNQKREGLVEYGNKVFSLTEKGLSFAKELKGGLTNKKITSSIRLPRYVDREISRVKNLEGFLLFLSGKKENILDTDFYNYLGVTARTEKANFLGRLGVLRESMEEIGNHIKTEPLYEKILAYHEYLINKFGNIIEYNSGK